MTSITRILSVVLLFGLLCVSLGRGIWKKRRVVDEEEGFIPQLNKRPSINSLQKKTAASSSNSYEMLDKLINDVEVFVDSPQFSDFITPDTMQAIVQQIQMLPNADEITQFISTPEFTDPSMLKSTIKKGLSVIQAYLISMKDILADPEQLQLVLEGVPAEYRPFVEQMLNGDISGLQGMLSSLPGMTPSNQALIESMMSGDTSAVSSTLKSVFEDSSQLELARQQFIENPDLAAAFGLSPEMFLDERKWHDFITQTLEAMESESGIEGDSIPDKSKLFSKARAM